MSKKLTRTPCDLGWTDHAFRRLCHRMRNNIPEKRRYKRKKRFVSILNSMIYNKVVFVDGIPF